MTREEYETLLKSDYWKGYSYSLIKERNFTCEDCGRQFPNERNKLQVHHLVYRDVKPWSYRPNELVVLCEDCHRKHHGIAGNSQQNATNIWDKNNSSTTDTFSASGDINSKTDLNGNRAYRKCRNTSKRGKKFRFEHLLLVILIVLSVFYYWGNHPRQEKETGAKRSPRTMEKAASPQSNQTRKSHDRKAPLNQQNPHLSTTEQAVVEDAEDSSNYQPGEHGSIDLSSLERLVEYEMSGTQASFTETNQEMSSLEILERRNHADVVKRARRAGVDTTGTTLDILERINHADAVKRARREGVSTEGTTLEILERINHADVVKQARRKGIDTSGSTLDILERINHADVVKRAKRLGVSTEGSTLEILERISRKELEKYR